MINGNRTYLRGECYCSEVYEDGELVHSCGGFTGAFDKAVKDMIKYLPDDCAGMVNDLSETDGMPSMVQSSVITQIFWSIKRQMITNTNLDRKFLIRCLVSKRLL